jgi:HK97 gp10 family phage protein
MSTERTSSLERFRLLTEDMKKQVHINAVAELNQQAGVLKQAIESVAPVYEGPPVAGVQPGALKHSVSVAPDRSKDTVVRVIAGGALTVRPSISSQPYDYSRADEFGTQKMPAHPFFFPTYRLMKKKIIAQMKRRITIQIKKYSAVQGGGDV